MAASSDSRLSRASPARTYRAMEPTSSPRNSITRLLAATISEKPAVARRTRAMASAPRRPRLTTKRHPAARPRPVAAIRTKREKMANPSIVINPENATRLSVSPEARASAPCPHCRMVNPAATARIAPTNHPSTRGAGFHWTSTSSTRAAPMASARSGAMAIHEISGGVIITHHPLRTRRRSGLAPASCSRSAPRCGRGPPPSTE